MLKPSTDETEGMIIAGILVLYLLITGFAAFLYLLHRISIISAIIATLIFTIAYIPRFLIIHKLRTKDKIKVLETSLVINNTKINFEDIRDFRINKKKPSVIFVFNNNLIVYQEAEFYIHTTTSDVEFKVVGSEKIELLYQFLSNIKS